MRDFQPLATPRLLVLLLTLCGVCVSWSAAVQAAPSDRRVALVVGVSRYQDPGIPSLPAAATDAQLMATTLLNNGFEVISVTDPDRGALLTALGNFSVKAQNSAVSLFYYAGHGIEYESRNLLLPSDMPKSPENGVVARGRAVTLDEVLSSMRGEAKVVILDACRDNPLRFADTVTRSLTSSAGLVEQRAEGILTIYSAGRGQQALDGLFTRVLVEESQKPNADFRSAVIATRQRVIDEAKAKNHAQRPAYYDEMDGTFSLTRAAAPGTQTAAAAPPAQPQAPANSWGGFAQSFSAAPPPANPTSAAPDAPPSRRRPRVESDLPPQAPQEQLAVAGAGSALSGFGVATRTRDVAAPPTAAVPPPAGDAGVAICQIGARVFGFSDGAWYAGRVLRAGEKGCKVRFDGFGSDDDDEVPSAKLLPWTAQGPGRAVERCHVGEAVLGFSERGWYPAKVRKARDEGCTLHYDGFGADEDEELPLNLIRKL